jgi:hypothetical protein
MSGASTSELGVDFAMDSELICVLIKIKYFARLVCATTRGRK